MTELVKYDAALKALAEAVAVDEVVLIRNRAEAMRHAARIAGDKTFEIQGAQLRFRAERRFGEMMAEQHAAGKVARGGRPKVEKTPDNSSGVSEADEALPEITLRDLGVNYRFSSRAQKLAEVPSGEFDSLLERHADEMRAGKGRVAMDLLKIGAEEKGRVHRRDLAQALSERTAELPSGRRYPAAYIDLPWKREGGIGDRAYENHYPTMAWPEILEFLRNARNSLLPDSWAFFWIPRAHLLALVEIELEVTVSATGEVTLAKVNVPLGWAVGHALGMDSYSTCFVWTKTDEQHPDVSGSGLIAWDQDELLLLFKRGQGLPKPSGAEKYGSNHRERPREHSRKPDHYRKMIADMVGFDSAGNPLPVLEMFARVDAEHPLPPGWDACGNQASASPIEAVAPTTLPPADDPEFLEWKALSAIEANIGVTGPMVQDLIDRGLVVDDTVDGRLVVTDDDGQARLAELTARFQPQDGAVDGSIFDGKKTAAQELAERPQPVAAAARPSEVVAAFPPTEYADLLVLSDDAALSLEQIVDRLPEYAQRGLATDALGRWRLTGAGKVRLAVLERERAERVALFKKHLDDTEFWDWRDLAALAGGEHLDAASVRSLVGLDLAGCSDDLVFLTDAGRARLAELEAIVERAQPAPVELVVKPRQLDIEELLGPPGGDPLELPAFLRRAPA